MLSLGDSSYEFFCQTGKDFDTRLAELGATRVHDRVDCDVDYQEDAAAWVNKIVDSLKDELTASTAAPVAAASHSVVTESQYNKENPYTAELATNQKITGRDSAKDVRHIEIDLGESGLTYQTGDALGVYFDNDPALVDELISALSLEAEQELLLSGNTISLKKALVEKLEITANSTKLY